jgi:hypothetical protein
MLPILALLFVLGVDFARLFYHYVTITNCARNGALWASDPFSPVYSPYSNVTDAALADSNLSPAPTVTVTGPNGDGDVSVTVRYGYTMTFNYLLNTLGIPDPVPLERTVTMRVAPTVPIFP